MTKEEAIQDYIREVEDHDYSVAESQLGNNRVKNRSLRIKDENGKAILVMTIENNPGFDPDLDELFHPIDRASIDLQCWANEEDLINYCWLFMRTSIFLKDMEKFDDIK